MARSWFLDPMLANADGLVAVGGDLSPARLLEAYRSGIFPWYDNHSPIYWWSPDPRGVFELESFHASRRLLRTYRSGKFRVTLSTDFEGVIRSCAEVHTSDTWITNEMIAAYVRLHELGHAESVEVWQGSDLVGGVYGVSIGGFFAGESMFHRVRDASKIALYHLVEHLRQRGYGLLDVQMVNPHTENLGATEIRRHEYLKRLKRAIQLPVKFQP
jgi:leucyl/phenylalanyl-tRNA--protein transferase